MKNKTAVVVIMFVIGAVFFYWMGRKANGPSLQVGAAAGKTASGKKILYWRAPMDPNYISDKPGKSPMGMDLVPVYAGEGQAAGLVKINPVIVQDIGVRTAVIKKRQLRREIRAFARITYDEQKVADVNTKVMGWLEKLYVNYEGQEVKEGDPLFAIYSPQLVSTQQEYLLALDYQRKMQASHIKELDTQARGLLASATTRLKYWDIPQRQIEELQKYGRVRKTMLIRSPVTGVVVRENALEGQMVKPGKTLYKIADLSRVWIYADIYQYELPWVHVGQKAEVTLSYLPGQTFTGKIDYIYPFLENTTRTVRVRLAFNNPTGELKPGMFANVNIDTAPTKQVLAVPQEAVIHSGERDIIIIAKGRGMFEPRTIKTGMKTRNYVQVLSGVKAGETVVTSAQFLIDSESQLNAAIQDMLEKTPAKKEGRAAVHQANNAETTGEASMKNMDMKMNMDSPADKQAPEHQKERSVPHV